MKNFKNIILTILLALPLVGMSQTDVVLRTQDEIDVFTATSITGDLTIEETFEGSTREEVIDKAAIETLYPNDGLALDVIKVEPTYLLDYTNDNPGLLPFIENFVRDANANGHNLKVKDIYGAIATRKEITDSGASDIKPWSRAFALAHHRCTLKVKNAEIPLKNFIYIKELWEESNDFTKKRIIYHELGHSLLDYKHTTSKNEIMTPGNWVLNPNLPGAIERLFSGENQIAWNACTGVEEPVGATITYLGHKTFRTQAEMDAFSTTHTGIRGDLTIQETTVNSITNLSGLRSLRSVDGNLSISSNAALSSLSDLENITTLEGNLYIGTNSSGDNLGNPNLVNLCGIRQLINNGEITNSEYFVGNNNYNPMYLQIQNANTCYSTTASVRDFIEKGESIIIYPNPAKDILHIESEESITFVEIINTLGQVVLKTTESKAIHIGFLPSGVYFVKVTDGLKATLVKILKN